MCMHNWKSMPFHSPQDNKFNLKRNVACRKTYRNEVADFISEFYMKPGNQSMTKIIVNMYEIYHS